MALYTSEYLKNIASRKQQLFEQRTYSVRNTAGSTKFDIFLSHSFLDKDEVQGLYQELTDFGFSVYVDWIVDPHLDRNNVNQSSALLIQSRLRHSTSLLLGISTNAAMSKWMPWELGYVDGHTSKCAIIPVSKEKYAPTVFKGTEYLSLYPFIKKVPTTNNIDTLWVIKSEYDYSTIDYWLTNGYTESNRNVNIFSL